MDLSELVFTEEELSEAVAAINLTTVEWPLCHHYVSLFGKAVDTHAHLHAPLQFLAIACGWWLRADQPDTPFDPAIRTATTCSPSWDQVSDAQVTAVTAIGPGIEDVELRARLCDLVWLRTRNHSLARTAADAYVRSAERLVARKKIAGEEERLKRAIQLAAQLGRKNALFRQTVNDISAIAESPELPNCSLATCLDLMLDSKCGDVHRLYDLAIARASTIEGSDPNPLWERRFWELAHRFSLLQKDGERSTDALKKVAITFEREAEQAPSQIVAAHFWHGALQTYRRMGAEHDATRVHHRMLEAQSQALNEIPSFETGSVDVTEIVEMSRRRILPNDKFRSFANLVFATRWLSKTDVIEKAKRAITEFPLSQIFTSVHLTRSGKPAAIAPGVSSFGSDIPADRLMEEMCQQYRYFIPIVCNGCIEPMRYEFLRQYSMSLNDVAQLVHYSSIVPSGRESLFVIGLHAGLHGRFIEAIHILLPQIENAIRCLLAQNGSIASSVREDGIQLEFELNRLLTMPETESVLGDDITFAMRSLFTDKFGYKLRNHMAHGMLEPGVFFSDAAVYSWWLVLRVVCGSAAQALLSSRPS